MKKQFYLLIFLIACNNVPKTPVIEPLELETLNSLMQDDSTFEQTYEIVSYMRDSVLTTDIEMAKWSGLSYRRFHKYQKFRSDTTNFIDVRRIAKENWSEEYGTFGAAVDSAIFYWKQYIVENSVDNKIEIVPTKIWREYYSYIGSLKDINIGFKLIPQEGTISQVIFSYKITSKIEGDTVTSINDDRLMRILDWSRCETTSPFSSPVTRYWKLDYNNKDKVGSRNITEFLRDYNVVIDVESIRKDGVNHSDEELPVPESIKKYLEFDRTSNQYGYSDSWENPYVKDIIKELFNSDYVSEQEFVSNQVDRKCKEYDQLSFDYLNAFIESYFSL